MIVIIDYGMGNLRSVSKALEFITDEEVTVSRSKEDLEKADRAILPGVGSFGNAMQNLKKFGLIEILRKEIIEKKKPLLGICLGMQILAEEGFEHGHHNGLGFIPGKVTKFNLDTNKFKIPHVGWNNIKVKQENQILSNIKEDTDFYFVHSFQMECTDEPLIVATCSYGHEFVAAIKKDNIFATQFHPEKSQQNGLKILKNFIKWDGS